ncbi:MAG: hypothetical protein ACRBF0_13895 [Calditrichia bacterium]
MIFEASSLQFAGGLDAGSDDIRRFTSRLPGKLVVGNCRDFDVNIDPV